MVNRRWLTVFGFMISRLFGLTVTARTLKNTGQRIWMFELLMIITVVVNSLYQVINEPTRITQYSESLLDLIITNCPGYFVNCGTLSPPANCDYSLIFARLNISVSKPKCYNRRIWQFNDVNEAELCNELAHFDWDAEVFSNLYDINAIYCCWFKHFHDIVKTKIPSRIVMIRPRDKPWMDSSVRLAMRKRDRLLKLYCKYKTRPSWEKYRQQRNLTTTLIRKNKAKYFYKVNAKLQDVTTGVKAWWSIVKGLYGEKVQSTVSTLIEGVRQVTNAREKAEILNE